MKYNESKSFQKISSVYKIKQFFEPSIKSINAFSAAEWQDFYKTFEHLILP